MSNQLILPSEYETEMSARRQALLLSYPYPTLMDKHLDGARLLPTREVMLPALPNDGIAAEIGVASGDFSQQILQLNKPKKLHLIDCWDSERYGTFQSSVRQRFEKEISSGVVEINIGLSTEVLATFKDGYFDWVYIDTVHDYKTTAQELLISKSKVKKGGVIAGHDYCQGNMISGWSYGVIQAVHEFCVKNDWKIKFLTTESHCYLSFAITEICD
jgi:hypothetical protein